MLVTRYRARHLRARHKKHGPAVIGTAAAVWLAGPVAHASTYVVRRGDTLSGIASRFGTSVGGIASANKLSTPNLVMAGQSLEIPARLTMTSTHEVAAGETLSSIAQRFGTSVGALARANHLGNRNLIVTGRTLKVPSTSMAASSAISAAPAPVSVTSIQTSLERHSSTHGVDPTLVKAVAYNESGWHQDVVSSVGAVGVMQIMPGTAKFVNRVLGGGSLDLNSADDNVHLGVMYLSHLLSTMPGERRALAAYFAGPANVGHKLTKAQDHYADVVEGLKARF
jgi:N-acetylmuramoyl-L-alanine amidase